MRQFLLAARWRPWPRRWPWPGAGYRIQPGDMLAITVLEDETLNRQVLVLPDGRISVPLAGTVQAAGQTVETVEGTIADRLASNFAVRPSVFVSVVSVDEEQETFPIFVLGQVAQPGADRGRAGHHAAAGDGARRRPRPLRRHQAHPAAPHRLLDRTGAALPLQLQRRRARRRDPSMITLREGDVIIVPERRLFE